jgi:hypothetical protein
VLHDGRRCLRRALDMPMVPRMVDVVAMMPVVMAGFGGA